MYWLIDKDENTYEVIKQTVHPTLDLIHLKTHPKLPDTPKLVFTSGEDTSLLARDNTGNSYKGKILQSTKTSYITSFNFTPGMSGLPIFNEHYQLV